MYHARLGPSIHLGSFYEIDCWYVSGDQSMHCPTQDTFESEVDAINNYTRKNMHKSGLLWANQHP